jgi:hypothetical protein
LGSNPDCRLTSVQHSILLSFFVDQDRPRNTAVSPTTGRRDLPLVRGYVGITVERRVGASIFRAHLTPKFIAK